MTAFDILLNDDYDLEFQGGDLAIGEATRQNQNLILVTNPGEWRAAPLVGVGIQSMILDDAPTAAITSEIQEQMEADGLVVDFLTLGAGGAIDLAAYYPDKIK
ncbi:MAG: hypothetical protein V4621_08115 [Pseudomonadota bacterium]